MAAGRCDWKSLLACNNIKESDILLEVPGLLWDKYEKVNTPMKVCLGGGFTDSLPLK